MRGGLSNSLNVSAFEYSARACFCSKLRSYQRTHPRARPRSVGSMYGRLAKETQVRKRLGIAWGKMFSCTVSLVSSGTYRQMKLTGMDISITRMPLRSFTAQFPSMQSPKAFQEVRFIIRVLENKKLRFND